MCRKIVGENETAWAERQTQIDLIAGESSPQVRDRLRLLISIDGNGYASLLLFSIRSQHIQRDSQKLFKR